jgi:hypothetical protein
MGREHIAEYRKREPRDRRATGKPQDASGFRAKAVINAQIAAALRLSKKALVIVVNQAYNLK